MVGGGGRFGTGTGNPAPPATQLHQQPSLSKLDIILVVKRYLNGQLFRKLLNINGLMWFDWQDIVIDRRA